MAEYHVRVEEDGEIYAGTLSKTGKWTNKSAVTSEALESVRDLLLKISVKEGKDIFYAWNYDNGKTLILKFEVKDSNEIREEEPKEGE